MFKTKFKKKFVGAFHLFFVLAFLYASFFVAHSVSAANLCAYVAPDGKYACVPGTEARAAVPDRNTCGQAPGCTGRNPACLPVEASRCGQLYRINACVAANGRYACSPANKKDLSDVPNGACTGKPAVEIEPALCGQLASAATTNTTPTVPSVGAPECSGPNPDPSKCLYNPLPVDELTNMFLLIARGMFAIVGIWAVIFVIVGGFKMVIAQGNEEALANAKKTITWAILGVVVAALAFSIIAIVQNVLQTNVRTF